MIPQTPNLSTPIFIGMLSLLAGCWSGKHVKSWKEEVKVDSQRTVRTLENDIPEYTRVHGTPMVVAQDRKQEVFEELWRIDYHQKRTAKIVLGPRTRIAGSRHSRRTVEGRTWWEEDGFWTGNITATAKHRPTRWSREVVLSVRNGHFTNVAELPFVPAIDGASTHLSTHSGMSFGRHTERQAYRHLSALAMSESNSSSGFRRDWHYWMDSKWYKVELVGMRLPDMTTDAGVFQRRPEPVVVAIIDGEGFGCTERLGRNVPAGWHEWDERPYLVTRMSNATHWTLQFWDEDLSDHDRLGEESGWGPIPSSVGVLRTEKTQVRYSWEQEFEGLGDCASLGFGLDDAISGAAQGIAAAVAIANTPLGRAAIACSAFGVLGSAVEDSARASGRSDSEAYALKVAATAMTEGALDGSSAEEISLEIAKEVATDEIGRRLNAEDAAGVVNFVRCVNGRL